MGNSGGFCDELRDEIGSRSPNVTALLAESQVRNMRCSVYEVNLIVV